MIEDTIHIDEYSVKKKTDNGILTLENKTSHAEYCITQTLYDKHVTKKTTDSDSLINYKVALNNKIIFEPMQYVPLISLLEQQEEHKALFITDEVGVGKTFEVGIILKHLIFTGDIRLEEDSVLLIAPKILTLKWLKVLDEYFQIPSTIVNSAELEGGLPPGVWITSYSAIARATPHANSTVKMLIMDEAHKLKDSKSKAYQFVGQFESIPYKIMLSATPDSGKKDLDILLGFLYGETDEAKYRDKFENKSKYRTNTKKSYLRPAIKREIKLDQLDSSEHKDVYRQYVELFDKLPNRLFASIAYKVLSSSLNAAITFLENIIEKTGSSSQYIDALFRSDGEIDSGDEYYQDEEYEDSDYDGEQSHDVELLRHRFLEEITVLSDRMRDLLNSRGEWKYPRVKHICHTAANKKTVIFATYKQSLYGLMEALQDEFDIRDVTGETDIHQRNNIVDWFKNNVTEQDKPKVILLGNVGCEGLDFETSSTLINFDMDYNPTVIEQRIGRVDRLKQARESITVHNFADGISDVRIYEILAEKIIEIFRGTGNFLNILSDQTLVSDQMETINQEAIDQKKLMLIRKIFSEEVTLENYKEHLIQAQKKRTRQCIEQNEKKWINATYAELVQYEDLNQWIRNHVDLVMGRVY